MSSAQTSYEVYILQGADKWTLHVRHGPADRKRAIETAKQLDVSKGVKAVRVIREIYNPNTNEAEEVVVYETKNRDKYSNDSQKRETPKPQKSSNLKTTGDTTPARAKQKKAASGKKSKKRKPNTKQKPKPSESRPTVLGLFLKLAIVILVSLFVGTALTLGADYTLAVAQSKGLQLSKIVYDFVLIGTFLFGFLAVFLPLLTRLFKQSGGGKSRRTNTQQAAMGHRNTASRPAIPKKGPSKAELKRTREQMLEKREEEKKAEAQQTQQKGDDQTDRAAGDDDQTDKTLSDNDQTDKTLSADDIKANDAADSEDQEINLPEETPKLKTAKTQMLSFLGSALEAAKKSGHKLDQRNKFGVSLFVAGACDICAKRRSLTVNDAATVLHHCICALGTAPNVSKNFVQKIPDYLIEPQYKDMYDKGSQAMDRFTDRGESGDTGIHAALEDWNRPVHSAGGGKLMAIMFTDIVNSTALTQKLGDHGAQEMVHIHNKLVRSEIIAQMGREIKHMGDGIMCSFNTPTAAVEAGVAMQKAVRQHNESGHHIQFEIRIGINAGEPIREENDLFGSTVQMAARVCSKAESYQVYVSDSVRSNASAKSARFTSAGSFELKGFSEPVELFEAVWRQPG